MKIRNNLILIFVVLFASFSNCISTTYIQANKNQKESEVVVIPHAGNLRPVLILGIDNQTFQDDLADRVVMSPGKHTIHIRSIESEFLRTSLTRTFNPGTILIICPGLNRTSHHNQNLVENDRWTPFIREVKYNDASGLINASLKFKIKNECIYGYQNKFPNTLEK